MKHTWPDLPGMTVWPWPAGSPLRVRIDDPSPAGSWGADPAALTAAIDARWDEMRRANPRLFDDPILSVTSLKPGHEIVCEYSSYKRLAVQDHVLTGVEQLSVTGVVIGAGAAGPSVLIGRRGATTRIYGGKWELAPSGGIDAEPGRPFLADRDIAAQLQREFEEETGSRARLRNIRTAAICHDAVAHSYDVVLMCEAGIDEVRGDPGRWEYDGVRWARVDAVGAFDRDHSPEIIAPTRALFRYFGWV